MELPFLKKKISHDVKAIPNERVKELSSKGFSELETIDVLRREGYSADEIEKALTQSLKTGVTEPVPAREEQRLPTLEDISPKAEMPEVPETSLSTESYSQGYSPEEYINYVVDEKIGESNKSINDISVKTKELEKRIEQTYDQVNALIQSRSSEQSQILDRIDSFKESVSDMDVRLGGLEKAFKETLPALIESVRMLSDLLQRFKKEV